MHRDVITHILVTKLVYYDCTYLLCICLDCTTIIFIFMYLYRSNFVITASCDGHVKFWKKQEEFTEFVKHFRAHLMAIQSMAASCNGVHACTISLDKTIKIFDVINFGKYSLAQK